jgi:hypothetical protein
MVLSQMFNNSTPPISLYLFGHFFLSPSALVKLELSIPPIGHTNFLLRPITFLVHTLNTLPLAAKLTHSLAAQHTLPAAGAIPLSHAFAHSCRWTTYTALVSRSLNCAERKLKSAALRVLALENVANRSLC